MVIERYPDSEYAASAILKFDLAFDHLAGKEMEIGRYYLRRENYAAAINRFRVVVEEFQTTSHTPEALLRLVEAYLALGLPQQAQTAAAILGHNFQASPFYDDAFRYAQRHGACAGGHRRGLAARRLAANHSGRVALTQTGSESTPDAAQPRHS